MDCPGCHKSYSDDAKVNTVIGCPCGKILLVTKISNKKLLADVSPKK